ncbi:hypothetical protein [Paraburkholderia sp.]|uniref:hypothetical protein n=1 Tax=Paraburkholderia sp. TaxID=1926495 RepID=UPI003C7D0C41
MKTIAWLDADGRAIAPPQHGHIDLKNERQWMAARVDDTALVKRATADDLLWALTDLIEVATKGNVQPDTLARAIAARDNAEAE